MIVDTKDFHKVVDYDPDPELHADYMDQEGFEEEKASWLAGDITCLYVFAAVTINIPHGTDGTYITHDVHSPGLYGIFVYSQEDPYLDEVYKEECNVLISMLTTMGMSIHVSD